MDLESFLTSNTILIGIMIPLLAIALSLLVAVLKFWQYVNVQKAKQRQVNFENYHLLIERINSPLKGQRKMWLDVQRAAVFELRNYPSYKEVSILILESWLKRRTELDVSVEETLKILKQSKFRLPKK